MKYIKLSKWAKNNSVTYRTAFSYWQQGILRGYQNEKGSIFIEEDFIEKNTSFIKNRCVIYSRVSSSENKNNLESQCEKLIQYASAKGYQIVYEIKEVGSGLNDKRQQLQKILEKDNFDIIIVEHKDRLTRFGFNYLETLLKRLGVKIEVVNLTDEKSEDLIQDFISIITSFCARIYGIRRSKRQTERLIQELNKDEISRKNNNKKE